MRYNEDYGAMLVEATADAITFQFIARSGAVIDSYTLPPPTPAPTATHNSAPARPTSGGVASVAATSSASPPARLARVP